MSLLEYPAVRSSPSRPDALEHIFEDTFEDAFHAWTQDPAKPDTVEVGPDRLIPMLELARHLDRSPAELSAAACSQLGLPTGVTIATAIGHLLHATIAPDGPRCRSFRSATYYLRRLNHLDPDLQPDTHHLASSTTRTTSTRGRPDVH